MLLGQGPVVYDSTAQVSPAAPMAAPANPTPPAAPPRRPIPGRAMCRSSDADALIYQPQIESWTGNALSWRVAVALRPPVRRTRPSA